MAQTASGHIHKSESWQLQLLAEQPSGNFDNNTVWIEYY